MPIVLLVIAEYPEVLFQGLVCSFSLTITFRMISRSEMECHIESFAKRAEETRNEFRTSIRSDMLWNSVLRKHMSYKNHGEVFGSAVNRSRYEYCLLAKSVDDY